MDTLMQIVKRLSEEDYNMLLSNISTDKFSKPYIVLEAARHKVFTDAQMIEILDINPSTYYTLKSRLNSKVAAVLSKKVENPISALMNEVSRVPAILYGTNKQVAVRSLKELEKQLLEYDLSNELIIVYHALARLYTYREEFQHYQRLYNKFVAFALASEKAENVFYDFIFLAGEYQLIPGPELLEKMESSLRELSNIAELYNSHRLFVYYNIMRIYFLLVTVSNIDALVLKEMEIDKTLKEIKAIFDRYPLDTFYNTIKFIIETLYFEYYQKIRNNVRALYHYNNVIDNIADCAAHYILNFHIVQFLNAKIAFYISNKDDKIIKDKNEAIIRSIYIETDEVYNYISFQKYLAIIKYYEGNYSEASGILNSLRNSVNLKPYWLVEMDCKLFQAFQHAILKEEGACRQLIGNIERNLRTKEKEYLNIKLFIKVIKVCLLAQDTQIKASKISNLWESFQKKNVGNEAVLSYLLIDNKVIQNISRQ